MHQQKSIIAIVFSEPLLVTLIFNALHIRLEINFFVCFKFRFSCDGCNIAIGNEKGNVHISALDEMPFPPYFQYEALEKAIYKAVATDPDLLIELRSVGYFGYPNKACVIP